MTLVEKKMAPTRPGLLNLQDELHCVYKNSVVLMLGNTFFDIFRKHKESLSVMFFT